MSRYTISETESLEVVVGWDAPLGTFFAQVFDNTVSDDEDECVAGCGRTPHELPTVSLLRVWLLMKGLPEIPPNVQDCLAEDEAAQWEPGPLQRKLGFMGKES